MAVIATCEDSAYLDGVTLYSSDDSEAAVGRWVRARRVTSTAELVLAQPGREWTAEQPLGPLPTSGELRIYAWTEDNQWSASGPSFVSADLEALRQGQVWFERYDESSETFENAFVDADTFQADACDNRF